MRSPHHVGIVGQADSHKAILGGVHETAQLEADPVGLTLPGDDVLTLRLPAALGLAVTSLGHATVVNVDWRRHLKMRVCV